MELQTETAARGRFIRIRGILVRVREFGLEDVVYEWRPASLKAQKRADKREAQDGKGEQPLA